MEPRAHEMFLRCLPKINHALCKMYITRSVMLPAMMPSTVYHTTDVVEYGLQCTFNLLWNLSMSDTDTGVQ
jgi:hypothetical protein